MKARRKRPEGDLFESASDEITFYALDFVEPFCQADLAEVASPSEANYWLKVNVANGNLTRRWNGKNYEFRWIN